MYENHRDNFGRRRLEEERGNREQRWRRGEDRYRREAAGQGHHDDYRFDDKARGIDDDYIGSSWYGIDERQSAGYRPTWNAGRRPEQGYRERGQSQSRPSRDYGWADHDRPGDSSYFTGTQGSWAVRPSSNPAYGPGGFGDDYREHGFGRGGEAGGEHRGFFEKAGDEIASWFGDEDAARRREQDHRGRGPKDYVRSDERIRDDANDCLTDDWRIDASDVTVRVASGEVTLDGTVPDRASKRRAEDLVEDISGVKHVQNNLRVAETSFAAQNRSTSDAGGMISGSGGTTPTAAMKSPEKSTV